MSTKKLQILGSVLATDETLTQSGFAADSQAVGSAIDEAIAHADGLINSFVGDVPVSTQIQNAIAAITRESLLMVVSSTEPTSPTTGMLWFDIS